MELDNTVGKARIYASYARTLSLLGHIDQADHYYQCAIEASEIKPWSQNITELTMYAYFLLEHNRYKDSIDQFQAAIDFNDEWPTNHWGLAQAYKALGNNEKYQYHTVKLVLNLQLTS